jgi:hypothetical protein
MILIAISAPLSFSYDGKTSFPLIIRMDSAGINGDVASAVGGFIFPEYKDAVKNISQWAATLKGGDVHVTLNINDGVLTFTPNDLMDAITLKGLKTVRVQSADVKDIYDVTSGWNDFRSVILATKSGTMLFHLDGESVYWLVADFQKVRLSFPESLARACPAATVHHVTCRDEVCGQR